MSLDREAAPLALQQGDRPSLVFLGCGQAARMHSRTLRNLDGAVRLFYASREIQRASTYAKLYRGEGVFGSYTAALADKRAEVAVVVTPPASHLEWTLAALEAGKHVIVEKPAFVRSPDFGVVEQAAAAAGRQVLVAENYFYKPLAEALRRIFREQLLGRVLFLHVNALKHQKADGWRVDPSLAGGGALLEGGIHWISLLAHLGPEVHTVRAAVPGGRAGEEKSILVTLQYDQGAVGALSYSWEVPSLPGGLRVSRIYGSEGSATFESNGVFLATTGRRRSFRFPGLRDLLGYRAMFADFLNALRGGTAPRFTLADARRDVELVEEAYRSADARAI
jgi:predicted dehydrogenase